MKNIKIRRLTIFLFWLPFLAGSCEYQEIADAPYPEQLIYMPAAVHGLFTINDTYINTFSTPTPGAPYRFLSDPDNNLFIVPLGAYRSGVDNEGSFEIDISFNSDTINELISETDRLPEGTLLLPSGNLTTVNSVTMNDGEELAKFDVHIDLDFLKNNPNQVYAFGVEISSQDRNTNPDLSTTVVVIHTRIMEPTADFDFSTDRENSKKITFTNNSQFGMNFRWNFGDGSDTSTERSPIHNYESTGTYSVELITLGVAGDEVSKTKKVNVTE